MNQPLATFDSIIMQMFFDCIPSDTIIRPMFIIKVSIGTIFWGSAEPDMLSFYDSINTYGNSRILGSLKLTDPHTASLINGTAGTVLEMDEGHQFARGHPGMHVLPALLAASENTSHSISGKDFLKAFIIGYDIAARMGLATSLNPNMRPLGTWGGGWCRRCIRSS